MSIRQSRKGVSAFTIQKLTRLIKVLTATNPINMVKLILNQIFTALVCIVLISVLLFIVVLYIRYCLLLQDSQLGGRRQRSAIDAVLLLLNNIQSKNSRKKARQRIATILFLDVKGAFDHVSENQLLSICKELGLPIAFT